MLGRGGMATVYLAYDRKHLREVAIKVLRPDLAASLGAERFLKEIQIAARLTDRLAALSRDLIPARRALR
jgi:eukaryotic-like serine/threonine-protein kinase